jgi:IgA peptidase M64/peptidase M64-like protein
MQRLLIVYIFFLAFGFATNAQVNFDKYFVDATMRIDYEHSGTRDVDHFSLDAVYRLPVWPGSTVNLVDTLNRGELLFRVYDWKSGLLLYSRGYSSVFQEWQSTGEAGKGIWNSIVETVRCPFPKNPIQVSICLRSKYSVLEEVFTSVIDPNDPTQVNSEKITTDFEVYNVMENGDVHKKVDIVIIGEGYSADEIDKFKEDADHFNTVMFNTEPFKRRKNAFNVRAVCAVSDESGIDKPDRNIWKSTALHAMYNTFGSPRYILTEANKRLHDVAGQVPYDFICILINDNRYGGGGIYQQYTTTYTIENNESQAWQRDYVYVHEFGHSFGGLADEYYTSSTGYDEFYPEGVEPWEPNITRLYNKSALKWKQLLKGNLEIPTDWGKKTYDSLGTARGKLDRLADDYYEKRAPILNAQNRITANPELIGKVGAFEGAGYLSDGMYRPSLDCRMFSLSLRDFDPVCMRAIEQQIDFYSK